MPEQRRHDLVLSGGDIVDGNGAPRRRADVLVSDGRIVAIGDCTEVSARRRIDVTGRVVAPGFIDTHTHDDCALLAAPAMAPKVSQGVTTVVAGNCGISLAPLTLTERPPCPLDSIAGQDWFRFADFRRYVEALAAAPPAVNALLLVGHQTLRIRHVTDLDRPADAGERDSMRADVVEAMDAGAAGFSTGLGYSTSLAAPMAEVIELAAAAAEAGGLYCTHVRDETDGVEDAIEEAFEIGRRSGAKVVLSHHKVAGRRNHGRSTATLARVDAARRVQPVALDAYPYVAGSSGMTIDDIQDGVRTIVTWSVPHPECAGRDLDEIAQNWGCNRQEAASRLLPAGGVFFLMDEEDVRRILAYPHTMIGSDGLPGDAHPHPRLWGSFTRVLGHYAREVGLFTLEEAVRRMTGLPAAELGIADRGTIRVGAFADLVVLDPDTVGDRATYAEPALPSAGIDLVLVNGTPVWADGAATGGRPGKVLPRIY